MIQEELLKFLKENLTIEVRHSRVFLTEPDEYGITVEIKLGEESICKDTSYYYL